MEEFRQVLYYIFEKHLRQKSAMTNSHNHLIEDHTEMLPIGNKENEATFGSHLRNTNGRNRKNFFKYRQLIEKREDHLSLGSENGKNIYINPRWDYDNICYQNRGK